MRTCGSTFLFAVYDSGCRVSMMRRRFMTKRPSTAMINQVRHDIHPSASVVGGLILINLLQDLATKVQEFLFCDLRDERAN